MKEFTTWERERWMLWVESERKTGYGDAVSPLAEGGETSWHQLPLSGLPASRLALIQWTSVLSAVVQRAVYPGNVQLINLWSWPKIEAVQLSTGLWQGYNTKGSAGSRKPSLSFPSLPFLPSNAFTGEERDCVSVLAAAKGKRLKNGFH